MSTTEPTPEAVEALARVLWANGQGVAPFAEAEHYARSVLAAGYVDPSTMAAIQSNLNAIANMNSKYMRQWSEEVTKRQRVEALIDECTRGHDPVQQSLAYEFRDALDGKTRS